jgi:hypothetical protein
MNLEKIICKQLKPEAITKKMPFEIFSSEIATFKWAIRI